MKRLLIGIWLIVILNFLNCTMIRAETNMNGGGSGGGTEAGTAENQYSSGDDGVRLTVIDTSTKCRAEGTKTIDYYRIVKDNRIIIHFGKISKLEYMGVGGYSNGRNLLQSEEKYIINDQGQRVAYQVEDLPTIVSNSNSTSNIEEIKAYFNDSARLKVIASRVGISYEEFINGNYKLIIEPMIYITFQGNYIALTAHEAAKLDIALGGSLNSGGELRAKFVSFTHKNLPLAIFLEKKELGIKPWTGSKSARIDNGNILTYLGIGILSFAPEGNEVGLDAGQYVYRPDTDVITTVIVTVSGGDEDGATCDNPITVQFSGDYVQTTQVTGITVPQGGSRPVWIKWHTPQITEKINTTITAEITGGSTSPATVSIPVTISPLVRKEPENPTADSKPSKQFSLKANPQFPTTNALSKYSEPVTQLSWHTYTCTKRWEWTGDYYEDEEGNKMKIYETVYEYAKNSYSSKITYTKIKVSADRNTEGANQKNSSVRSGYGIEVTITSNVSGSSQNCTGIQSACVYFPEYNYQKYRRDAVPSKSSLQSVLELPINQYSLNGSKVHFTPIYFPDGDYNVYVEAFDAWTPSGMLCNIGEGSIKMEGNLWDDWYVKKEIQFK
ncbi:hypothetical protein [Anaeromicropila populeti]|uniref:Uncharacterized protein n=1 Tax=Anaeromicropila populeti TaxID=37658 RepID=A0A1I6JFR4_9FIRM|nr:hypothetical protein [Anaeromicropila populeti]SFR77827.1 hypothetical protein SAMN05661086_01648 [Anaeromicropila populeti]